MVEHAPNIDATVTRVRETIDGALASHDRPSAVAVAVEAVRSGALDVPTLYVRVLTPLLVDTGAAWQAGTTAVWEEHYASATVRTVVESLYLDVQRAAEAVPRNGKVALLACPREEVHELGLRMLADRLTLAGWQSHFLGADTPTEELVAAARALHADVIALSAATHYNRAMLCGVVDELAAALPGVRVGAGGPSFAHCTLDDSRFLTEAELGLAPTTGA